MTELSTNERAKVAAFGLDRPEYDLREGPSSLECREGQHAPACRGNAWTMSAEYPSGCSCTCHEEVGRG